MRTGSLNWRMVVAAVCAVVGLAAGPGAAERRPLPPFPLTMVDGTTTMSDAEAAAGTRLFVYLSPGHAGSDRLARLLKEWDSPALRAHTLVVLGRDMGNAREWIKAAGDDLQPLRFAVDTSGEGWRALHLTGAPHIVGVERGEVAWVVSGVLKTPGMLASIVKTWVQ